MKALITSDETDHCAEYEGLDKPVPDVRHLGIINALVDVRDGIGAKHLDTDKITAGDTNHHPEYSQEEHHHRARKETGYHQVFHRVRGERLKSIDLLGYLHGSQLRGHGRTGPACNHEACKHRPEFSCHRERYNGTDERFSAKPLESRIALERQHHAGGDSSRQHHGNGVDTDLLHLLQEILQIERPTHGPTDSLAQEYDHPAHFHYELGGFTAQEFKPAVHRDHRSNLRFYVRNLRFSSGLFSVPDVQFQFTMLQLIQVKAVIHKPS